MDTPRVVEPTPLTLDGRAHALLFTRRAVRQSELWLTRLWGKDRTFYQAIARMAEVLAAGEVGAVSLTDVTVLLWQGLLHDDPNLTFDAVEEMVPMLDPAALVPILVALFQAWQAASPPALPATAEAAADADPLAALPGAPSGPMNGLSLVSTTTSSGV